MNRTFAGTICLITALCGCDSAGKERDKTANEVREKTSQGTELPEPWFILRYSLSDYVKMQPGRPIIVSFGAYWTMTSQSNWRVLFSDEVSAFLQTSGFLCLVSDRGDKGNRIAEAEMSALNRVALPVTAVYDPVDKTWQVMPELLSADEVRKWVTSIQDKLADQSPDGQSATRSGLNFEGGENHESK